MKNTIKQYCAFLLTVIVILFTCADNEEFWVLDNPLDPQGNNWFPPSVEAMQDTTVAVYDSFYVHATGSDSNGTIYYYLWAIDDTNYTDTVNTKTFKIAFSTAGVKPVKVKVIDSDWLVSTPDSVDITVKSYVPTVVAMADTTVAVNDSFYVHATGSDSNRTVEKYLWALDGSSYNDTLDINVFKIMFSSMGIKTIAVKVIDNDGNVSVPDSVNITVKDKVPVNASPANGSTDQPLTPTLRWAPGFYDASFTVFLDTLNPPVQEAATALTDTFYTVTTPLEYNKTYYWCVAGIDTIGSSDTSGVWSFTTLKEITGLVAHYPFNGNADDFSGNGNHGSVNGAIPTADRFGNLNAAYLYNGSGDYISIPSLTPIQNVPINQFSFVAWMKSLNGDGSTPQNVFEVHTQAASGNKEVYFEANMPAAMRFGITDTTGGDHQIQSAVLSLNSWYQIIGTYDGSEQKIYINALLHDSQPWSSYFTMTPGAMLGKDIEGGQYFNGAIDDISIYNHALDSAEIYSLYHANGWDTTTNIDSGLVLYYPFNGNANDSSGNGNNVSLVQAGLTTDKDGNADKAYSFNGTNNYIRISYSSSLAWNDTQDFSAFVWFNASKVTGGNMLLACDPALYDGKFEWRLLITDKRVHANIDRSGMQGWDFSTDTLITTGVWYFAGYTYNGSTKEVRIYVNGVFDTSNTSAISGTVTQTGFDKFLVGAAWPKGENIGGCFSGKIDEVRIYNRRLSEAEILFIYNNSVGKRR